MEINDTIAMLSALAQGTRLEIFRLLVRAGGGGMPAGAIGSTLDLAPATLSFHLKELKNAGVVRCRREGRSLIYSPAFDAMQELMDFLSANCCEGVEGEARCGIDAAAFGSCER